MHHATQPQKKLYNGINFVNLSIEQAINGYNDPRWLTYKQAVAIGAQVRKGERSTTIQYWKFSEQVDKVDENGRKILGEDGKPEKKIIKLHNPKVFYSTVFNATQIDGMPELAREERPERKFEAIEEAENIIVNSGAKVRHLEGNKAYYHPLSDDITLPMKEQFKSEMEYYSTALHELGHWTGHPSRLDRDLSGTFGNESYAKEELRAEIASYMLCSELGVDFDPTNHHAYIKSWVKNLCEAPNEIFKAAADAGKITQFLKAFNMEVDQVVTQDQQLKSFDEKNLASKVDKAKYNNHKINSKSEFGLYDGRQESGIDQTQTQNIKDVADKATAQSSLEDVVLELHSKMTSKSLLLN